MINITYQSATYNAQGSIDVELYSDSLGKWLPFTATPDDVEKFGRDVFTLLERVADQYKGGT